MMLHARHRARRSRRSAAGIILPALAAAALMCSGVAWAGGGNSQSAERCQHGGWETLVRSDHSLFTNQGECVSYAARGGTLHQLASLTLSIEKVDCFNVRLIATGFGLKPGSFVSIYLNDRLVFEDYGQVEADGTISTDGGGFWGGLEGHTVTATATTAEGETITSPPIVVPPYC
jgi:hypothetical protein